MPATTSLRGLSNDDVASRIAAGQINEIPPAPSRTIPEIIRANVFTRFNALIGLLAAIVIAAGSPIDAMFAGVIVANAIIGIYQEVRAKRTLDRLAVLNAPHAHVLRDGSVTDISVQEIVLDDVIELRPGAQVVADAEVLECDALEVDESLLTGESDAEVKTAGSELLSGSFVVTGSGYARVTKVGKDAYAAKLAEEARKFSLANSELRASIEQIVTWVSWALIPAAIGLVWSQLRSNDDIRGALVAMVAGLVGMVPEGLVLLTSVAFFVGVVRLARQRTLVQELPAVEILARVDVVCLDKTGTITEGSMVVDSVVPLDVAEDAAQLDLALAAIAHADPNPNATQQALAVRFETAPTDWPLSGSVPFSSARKWSACGFDGHGWWVLGAAEMILTDEAFATVSDQIEETSGDGLRVLLLARSDHAVDGDSPLPADMRSVALVTLIDKIRPDAGDTLAYFAEQGVTLKVISGDNPTTVGAVAQRAGLDVAGHVVDARKLPTDDDAEALADAVENGVVFGRVTPHQKRAMVKALQDRGHTVAMTGDGVNDVLALKDADCGIAMASGSEATRAVAQIVLLDSSFSGLPSVVAEGRRVINNLQRVASLYLTKTTYAVIFAFITGIFGMDFPFLPRHLTLISTLCIGIPSFFLALAPNTARVQGNFLKRVGWDSIPFGIICAIATMVSYVAIRSTGDTTLAEQQTAATLTLAGCSLIVLFRNARPARGWKLGLVGLMALGVTAAFTLPFGKEYFQLSMPAGGSVWMCLGVIAAAGVAIGIAHKFANVDERMLSD